MNKARSKSKAKSKTRLKARSKSKTRSKSKARSKATRINIRNTHGLYKQAKPVDAYKNDKRSADFFSGYFQIPIVHYSPWLSRHLIRRHIIKWRGFLNFLNYAQSININTTIVPLMFDHKVGVWWADYAGSYLDRFNMNPTKNPNNLDATVKLDDNKNIIPNYTIHISHELDKEKSKLIKEYIKKYPYIKWSGRAADAILVNIG